MPPLSVYIIGGGLAGSTVAHELSTSDQAIDVLVIDGDPDSPYDRPPLTKRLLDKDFMAAAEPGWAAQGVKWLNDRVVALDPRTRVLTLESGQRMGWDVVVLATGGRPRSQSADLWGFSLLRTAADATWLRGQLEETSSARVLIEGAGPLGCEVASTLVRRGASVTLVEADRLPMRRLLGPELGEQIAAWATDSGVDLLLERHVRSAARTPSGEFDVTLSDGQRVHADIALSAIGMTPVIDLVAGWASADGRGIHCDAAGRVISVDGVPYRHVYAVGDVASRPDPATDALIHLESWTSASEQAAQVAAEILGRSAPPTGLPYFWTEVFGRRIQLLGRVPMDPTPPEELASYPERHGGVYCFYDDDGEPAAWVAINAPRDFAAIVGAQQGMT